MAGGLTDSSNLSRRAIRQLAHETATSSGHFGPLLADVAEAALLGRPASPHHDVETRAAGLAGIVASCYDRSAVVLALWAREPLDHQGRAAVGSAAQWLAGRYGIWVLGSDVVEAGRFPVVTLALPVGLAELARPEAPASPRVQFPVLAGRPHPGSAVELDFEATLARYGWAHSRSWNHVYQPHPLSAPIRVDLMWPAERVVVELDGPDHRGALKYADDRRRDNTLTLGGHAVLRFSNDEVTADVTRVLAMIEGLLMARRRDFE